MASKERLDDLLVARGLALSRDLAQRLVMAGQVRVQGQRILQPFSQVHLAAEIEIVPPPRFVSRGGEKLEHALAVFDVAVTGRVCADVGASTGGFTDCLLQAGARRVYAIDVGQGILDWKLRQDKRVVVMEQVNARSVEQLSEPVSLVTIDVSFISIKTLLPVIADWFQPGEGREVIALVKPQFEADRKEAARGKGVIRDAEVHSQILFRVLSQAVLLGWTVQGLTASPLLGPKGNREFLAWLQSNTAQPGAPVEVDVHQLIRKVIP